MAKREVWMIEVRREGQWRSTSMVRETRDGARKIARMFRGKGDSPRVVKYVPAK